MELSAHTISQLCSTPQCLTLEQMMAIDELTHSYGAHFSTNKTQLCNQVWELMAKVLLFWENCSLLLQNVQYDETRLQVLLLIGVRVREHWHDEAPEVRVSFKKYLCEQVRMYKQDQITQAGKSVFRQVNHILVEILKVEWATDWHSFVGEICEAIVASPDEAENLLHLIYSVFEQIFADRQKLTSLQIKKIREILLDKDTYPRIQKALELCLSHEKPDSIIRNSIYALESLIQWIPSYYLYFGEIIDKLLQLYQHKSSLFVDALDCLETVLALENEDVEQNFLPQLYQKKRQVILIILGRNPEQLKQPLVSKVLMLCLAALEQQKQDTIKYGLARIFPDAGSKKTHREILARLGDWVAASKEQDLNFVGIFKFIASGIQTSQTDNIIENLIHLTTCPFDTSYFMEEQVYEYEYTSSPDYERDRADFREMMGFVVEACEEQLFKYIIKGINKQYTTLEDLRLLCKLLWNFYYMVDTSRSLDQKAKEKVFAVTHQLLNMVQQAELYAKDSNNPIAYAAKLFCLLYLHLLLILSHPKCVNSPALRIPFTKAISVGFRQNNSYVRAMMAILGKAYVWLSNDEVAAIHREYAVAVLGRGDRLEIDLIYVGVLGSLAGKEDRRGLVFRLACEIIAVYRSAFGEAQKKKVSKQNQQQLKREILKHGLSLLKIFSVALPAFKVDLLLETQHQMNKLKQLTIVCNLTGDEPESIEFYKLSSEVYAQSFEVFTDDQAERNIDFLHLQATEITGFIVEILGKQQPCLQILESILEYLGKFVFRVTSWDLAPDKKIGLIRIVIMTVLERNYPAEQPGMAVFLENVVKCKMLNQINESISSRLIYYIIVLAQSPLEANICKAVQMFSHLLSESLTYKASQHILSKFIINFVEYMYQIMASSQTSLNFVPQFAGVLYAALVYIRNLKTKLHHQQISDNLTQVYHILAYKTKQLGLGPALPLDRVTGVLLEIINTPIKQQFVTKMEDLVICFRRGY